MKKKLFFLLSALVFLISGCASLHEQEKQFADTWVYACKSPDFDDPMIDYAATTEFSLNADGAWKFGESEGKWGNQENEQTYSKSEGQFFNLNFKDSKVMISSHASQYSHTSGSIQVIDGVETFVLAIHYTYDQDNFYQNNRGEVDSYSKEATASIDYYFVRKSRIQEDGTKLKDHFAEIKNKQNGNFVSNSQFSDPFYFIKTDTARVAIIFSGLKYNESKSMLNTKQRIALASLYVLKGEQENFNQMAAKIPNDYDSIYKIRMNFLAEFTNGRRDFTDQEIRNCSGLDQLRTIFDLLLDYKKVSKEELDAFKELHKEWYRQ